MNLRVEQLINIAKRKMKHSNDPVHDLDHVTRVVKRVKEFIADMDLSHDEKQAVILAAWWHDVARSITKNPSKIKARRKPKKSPNKAPLRDQLTKCLLN